MDQNIVAYSVRDSIIARKKDEGKAIATLRGKWSSNCTRDFDGGAKGVSQVLPALSITDPDTGEKDIQGIWK